MLKLNRIGIHVFFYLKNAKTTAIFLSDDDFDTIFSKSVLTRAATLFYIILLGHIFFNC